MSEAWWLSTPDGAAPARELNILDLLAMARDAVALGYAHHAYAMALVRFNCMWGRPERADR